MLPYTRDAFRKLVTTSGQFRVPTVFVTNAGNELRSSKAAKLSQILGIPVRKQSRLEKRTFHHWNLGIPGTSYNVT